MEEQRIVRRSALLFITLLAGWRLASAVPQSGTSASQHVTATPAGGSITASAVWQPPQDFLTTAHTACDKSANPANFAECFIGQMSSAGAPADAVSFTRLLYKQADGMVGIMTAFKKYGPVDAAQVLYPLRANDNYALLLVNGDPRILDVDDLQKLDRQALEQNSFFLTIKSKFPQTDLWPGDRSGNQPWPRVQPLSGGGIEFVIAYPLINGCHACRHVGLARFGWDFDSSGKFLHTTLIPTPPPPKLMRQQPPQRPVPVQPPAPPPQQ